jgi:predicted aspartyl protease
MTTTKWLAAASLAVVVFPAALSRALWAEPHCPRNAASIRPRFTGRSLIAVAVMLDSTGPYDFVVDTGAQITTIDPKLAHELHPKPLGATHVTGVGSYSRAAYAQLASIEAETHSIKDPLVIVQDLSQVQQADPRIRGILGENFLEHFDLLIDYEHRILCLDETKQLQEAMKGERIALTAPRHAEGYKAFMLPMVVAIRVSGIEDRPLLLQLDSGIDVPLLFECGKQLPHARTFGTDQGHREADEVAQAFAVLMPQDMRVGGRFFRQISFVTPVAAGKDIPVNPDVDGVIPTILFRSVFISYADRFAVIEP